MARPVEMKAFYDGFAEQHGRIVETLRPLSPEQMHAILGENAKVFFGLRPGDQSAERLKKFHGTSVALPFQRDKAATG